MEVCYFNLWSRLQIEHLVIAECIFKGKERRKEKEGKVKKKKKER